MAMNHDHFCHAWNCNDITKSNGFPGPHMFTLFAPISTDQNLSFLLKKPAKRSQVSNKEGIAALGISKMPIVIFLKIWACLQVLYSHGHVHNENHFVKSNVLDGYLASRLYF